MIYTKTLRWQNEPVEKPKGPKNSKMMIMVVIQWIQTSYRSQSITSVTVKVCQIKKHVSQQLDHLVSPNVIAGSVPGPFLRASNIPWKVMGSTYNHKESFSQMRVHGNSTCFLTCKQPTCAENTEIPLMPECVCFHHLSWFLDSMPPCFP